MGTERTIDIWVPCNATYSSHFCTHHHEHTSHIHGLDRLKSGHGTWKHLGDRTCVQLTGLCIVREGLYDAMGEPRRAYAGLTRCSKYLKGRLTEPSGRGQHIMSVTRDYLC